MVLQRLADNAVIRLWKSIVIFLPYFWALDKKKFSISLKPWPIEIWDTKLAVGKGIGQPRDRMFLVIRVKCSINIQLVNRLSDFALSKPRMAQVRLVMHTIFGNPQLLGNQTRACSGQWFGSSPELVPYYSWFRKPPCVSIRDCFGLGHLLLRKLRKAEKKIVPRTLHIKCSPAGNWILNCSSGIHFCSFKPLNPW